jgi:hypothetical protein
MSAPWVPAELPPLPSVDPRAVQERPPRKSWLTRLRNRFRERDRSHDPKGTLRELIGMCVGVPWMTWCGWFGLSHPATWPDGVIPPAVFAAMLMCAGVASPLIFPFWVRAWMRARRRCRGAF